VTPLLDDIVDTLVTRHRASGRVDLNDIAEVIGPRAVGFEEVEHIVDRLEAAGLRVGDPLDTRDVASMRRIIVAAHRLRGELGRNPTVAELAAASGDPEHAVRRALESAGRVVRGAPPR
jgi:ribosomal protein S12 methylthiotransferase accessory factor YcaO